MTRFPMWPMPRLFVLMVLVFGLREGFVFAWARHQETPARFEKEIQAFESADRDSPPRPGGVVFVGSSTIRMWDLDCSFPEVHALNRGFGGSEMSDATHFARRILVPYNPRLIVVYSGDNDIQKGKTPEEVARSFSELLHLVRENLPECQVVVLGIKPSVARWENYEGMKRANEEMAAVCSEDRHARLVDLGPLLLNEDGTPNPVYYREDGLHLSDEGYKIWSEALAPYLCEGEDSGRIPRN